MVTVSIVAWDAGTGCFGVATASLGLAVGSCVPVLEGGAGAAVVQALSPTKWRETVRDELSRGRSARQIREHLASADGADRAQVAIVDRDGGTAVLSGGALEPEAGEAEASGVCVAANLMERRGVPEATLATFRSSPAVTMRARLLDALVTADRLGGDLRGRQSAALRLVGSPDRAERGSVDLRVDDAPDPVRELQRLHRLSEAHRLVHASVDQTGSTATLTAPAPR
jgi:uncharacterized Ntn-hydrolase superfamily protein